MWRDGYRPKARYSHLYSHSSMFQALRDRNERGDFHIRYMKFLVSQIGDDGNNYNLMGCVAGPNRLSQK